MKHTLVELKTLIAKYKIALARGPQRDGTIGLTIASYLVPGILLGGDTTKSRYIGSERTHRDRSVAASLGAGTLTIVEKTSFEVRSRGGVVLCVIR